MNIVILYTTIGHYMYATIKSICSLNETVNLYVFFDDKKSIDKNYNVLEEHDRVKYIPKSSLSRDKIYTFILSLSPRILYFPAWQDADYLFVVKKFRKKNNKTIFIGGFDDIWFGTLRQKLGSIYFKLFLKKYIDFAWVSGRPQFSYAQRLGFNMNSILNDIYCADTSTFKSNEQLGKEKRFLFVGRFVSEKGLNILLDAYDMLDDEIKKKWNLHFIGSGSLLGQILEHKSDYIHVVPYLQKDELRRNLQYGGVCIIPSNKDQWGLPVQEMALLGYPLLVSSAVGSATEFLISGYNGYKFKKGNIESLYNAMLKLTKLNDAELKTFGDRSKLLGSRINSDFSAASFLSVLEFN
jgi:glycosyltransferase involved in cell wall biosynthesis